MSLSTIIHPYTAYDHWANGLFLDRLEREPEEVLDRRAPSSFPSLRGTMLHIRDAVHVWTCRLAGLQPRRPADVVSDLASVRRQIHGFHAHVIGMCEDDLMQEHTYPDLQGKTHRQAAWQMVMHCCNHSTQHRGQLITQMRQLGLEEIPTTDLVRFWRLRDA